MGVEGTLKDFLVKNMALKSLNHMDFVLIFLFHFVLFFDFFFLLERVSLASCFSLPSAGVIGGFTRFTGFKPSSSSRDITGTVFISLPFLLVELHRNSQEGPKNHPCQYSASTSLATPEEQV